MSKTIKVNSSNSGDRLRIGYLSGDLKQSSAMAFIEGLITNHNKARTWTIGLANQKTADQTTKRIQNAFDEFHNVYHLSDGELSHYLTNLRLDVLIELSGHTLGNRLKALGIKRTAPIVLTAIGFGYTTGLNYIDYFLGDALTLPPDSQRYFSEKLFPIDAAFPYVPQIRPSAITSSPFLTNGFVTFGTLSRSVRLNHGVLSAWSEILNSVQDSKLIVNSKNFTHRSEQERLIEDFKSYGISSERLLVGYDSPPWGVYDAIDIQLDCFPHGSGTTLYEGLLRGVPYITLAGQISIQLIGTALASRLSLYKCIASSRSDYICKAIELASDHAWLSVNRPLISKKFFSLVETDSRRFVIELEKKLFRLKDELREVSAR